eukprot:6183829-Pleurochrysis_carterae.AAC.1
MRAPPLVAGVLTLSSSSVLIEADSHVAPKPWKATRTRFFAAQDLMQMKAPGLVTLLANFTGLYTDDDIIRKVRRSPVAAPLPLDLSCSDAADSTGPDWVRSMRQLGAARRQKSPSGSGRRASYSRAPSSCNFVPRASRVAHSDRVTTPRACWHTSDRARRSALRSGPRQEGAIGTLTHSAPVSASVHDLHPLSKVWNVPFFLRRRFAALASTVSPCAFAHARACVARASMLFA